MRPLAFALLLLSLAAPVHADDDLEAEAGVGGSVTVGANCAPYTITFYSVEQFPGTTADGTRTPGNAWGIAAGSYNLQLGTWVQVEGLGTFRIADRGRLGARHVDILVQTTAEALRLGRQTRTVCEVGR